MDELTFFAPTNTCPEYNVSLEDIVADQAELDQLRQLARAPTHLAGNERTLELVRAALPSLPRSPEASTLVDLPLVLDPTLADGQLEPRLGPVRPGPRASRLEQEMCELEQGQRFLPLRAGLVAWPWSMTPAAPGSGCRWSRW